ncbi:hypothetical protein C8F04DRAFT_1260025 [Mycena alexandri]|uniref:Uncharacterized protein n=1 Tax=Mycena alexandri TaxID=1745969 RepID=A0AAD6SXR9_9AGAR|nr:hypothetical protein C8F04DRAFT_1260025 [Mycena alexandri]
MEPITLEMAGSTCHWETSVTSGVALQILRKCPEPRICELSVNDVLMDLDGHTAGAIVKSKSLHTLVLRYEAVESTLACLLDHLSLPELRHFSLHGSAAHDSPSLAQIFARWMQLERLEISGNTFSKSSLLHILRSLSDPMKHLTIHNVFDAGQYEPKSPLDDDILALLTGVSAPCPALETLLLDYCAHVSDEALLQFITARMLSESQANLAYVRVQFSRPRTFDILLSLQPFVTRGLDLSIMHIQALVHEVQSSLWQGLPDAPRATNPWY